VSVSTGAHTIHDPWSVVTTYLPTDGVLSSVLSTCKRPLTNFTPGCPCPVSGAHGEELLHSPLERAKDGEAWTRRRLPDLQPAAKKGQRYLISLPNTRTASVGLLINEAKAGRRAPFPLFKVSVHRLYIAMAIYAGKV
jgi:hypothetical protein